ADGDAGDRPRRIAADDVRRLGPAADPAGRAVPAQHPYDPDRPHHVQHQLRRRHREGAPVQLPAEPRRSRDGPRRERVDDLLEGDVPAHPAGHPRCGAARVQPVDRRLRRDGLHLRADRDVPALHLRLPVARHPRPGQRDRDDHLRVCGAPGAVDDPVAASRRGARLRSGCMTTETRAQSSSARGASLPDHSVTPPVWSRITNLDVDRGEGSWLITRDGERYLDYSSGIGVTNTGHAHPRVAAALAAPGPQAPHGAATLLYHEPGLRLYDRLPNLLPGGPYQAFLSNSGAEAIEASVKLARVSTGRAVIIRLLYGYPGRTAQTMAMTTAKDVYRGALEPLPGSVCH